MFFTCISHLIFLLLKSYLETITVQAPHPPSAQPNFVPLSPTVDLYALYNAIFYVYGKIIGL